MKKIILISLTAFTILGVGAASTVYAMNKQNTLDETTYLKELNPHISKEEITNIKSEQTTRDALQKEQTDLSLTYGILVDNEKDGNKEPVALEDLSATQQQTYQQLNKKVWKQELRLLEAQYKSGLVSDQDYKADKTSWEQQLNQ